VALCSQASWFTWARATRSAAERLRRSWSKWADIHFVQLDVLDAASLAAAPQQIASEAGKLDAGKQCRHRTVPSIPLGAGSGFPALILRLA
jgi:hypothetical protein